MLPLPDDTLLVSNVCGFNTTGDGFLSLLSGQGDVIAWRAVDELDAPLGMAMHEEKIFVVDANQVKIFAWPEFSPIKVISIDTKVANDIAIAPNGELYVSDTAAGRVVKVFKGGASEVFQSNTEFRDANGMEFGPDGYLYVGGERLWRVDTETGVTKTIGPEWLSDIDGIEFEPDGTIQIAPVGGALIRLQPNGSIEILGGDGISSTNHGYAPSLGLALIPTGFDNTVVAIRVP